MPNNSIISEGKTTNEAIENGLKVLKVSKDMVEIKVLENEDKRSFFSILSPRIVKVELTLKDIKINKKNDQGITTIKEKNPVSQENIDKAEENIKVFLDEFLAKIGQDIKYNINKNEYGFEIEILGKESSYLIGYRGETLYSFQSIISAVANKNSLEKIRISLDIEGYRSKREKTLQDLAQKIAKTVEKTKKSITLEPMHAYERKIIHSALQNSSIVQTISIGEEPRRRVVISLK